MIADDMDQLMLLLQLLPTGKISDTIILQQLGRDFTEELRRRKDDEIRFIQNDVDIQQEAGRGDVHQSRNRKIATRTPFLTMFGSRIFRSDLSGKPER
jgi:hypothetical protein